MTARIDRPLHNNAPLGRLRRLVLAVLLALPLGAQGAELVTLVKNIAPCSNCSSDPHEFTNLNGTLYFSANDGFSGEELWKSDGTSAGTGEQPAQAGRQSHKRR